MTDLAKKAVAPLPQLSPALFKVFNHETLKGQFFFLSKLIIETAPYSYLPTVLPESLLKAQPPF